MNSLWMPLFALLFFCEASVFRETDVIFSEFGNLLVNRCGRLHFHVVALSLPSPFAVLSANFENVL